MMMPHAPDEGFVPGLAGFALEKIYLAAMTRRRAAQLAGLRVRPRSRVVSIGNLTVGGTGKTPCTMWLAGHLRTAGRPVAIVGRLVGARIGDALSDEMALVLKRVPEVRVFAAREKSQAALRADETMGGSAVIVVDDGFSHWKLERDLDIVLIDGARPLGNGHLLPRGTLREPPDALARAGVIIVTRADRIDAERRTATREALARLSPHAVLAEATLVPRGLTDARGASVNLDPGAPVVCLSAIARKGDLARSAVSLGLTVVADVAYPDHHRFSGGEWRRALELARSHGATLVVTEKDAVRLSPAQAGEASVLVVDWNFLSGEADVIRRVGEVLV